MSAQAMRHYLLTPLEAEILACYRMLDEQTQDAVAHLIGSSVDYDRQHLDNSVQLSLVQNM